MTDADREWLRARIAPARGSEAALGAVFEAAVERFGHQRASELWWAVFGAGDASET